MIDELIEAKIVESIKRFGRDVERDLWLVNALREVADEVTGEVFIVVDRIIKHNHLPRQGEELRGKRENDRRRYLINTLDDIGFFKQSLKRKTNDEA